MKRLGKYIELEEIGRGASATVYRGKHRELGALRALKVFGPGSWKARNRLEEAVCQSRVEHECIVRVLDLEHDEAAGVSYMVMEYAPLGTLRTRLEDGAMDPAQACRLAAQMARALEAAHRQGIWHLDLKPENVLFFTPTQVKISDFGLARGAESMDPADPVVGTPGYMSPEQLEGRAGAGCDLWALGAVLHEMLAGRPAFGGYDVASISAAMETGPAPLPPAIDAELGHLVNRLLAYSPSDRPASAGEAADQLQRLAARLASAPATIDRPTVEQANRCTSCGAAIPLGLRLCPDCRPREQAPLELEFPPGPLLRPQPVRRRPGLAGLAMGLLVAVMVAGGGVWALSPGGGPPVAKQAARVTPAVVAPRPPAKAPAVAKPVTPKAKPAPVVKPRPVQRAAKPAPKARAAAAHKAAAGARRSPAIGRASTPAAAAVDPLAQARQGAPPQRTVEALRRHLAAHPDHLGARRNLALLYLQMGQSKAAEAQLNSILRIKPHDVEAKATLELIRGMRGHKTAQRQ